MNTGIPAFFNCSTMLSKFWSMIPLLVVLVCGVLGAGVAFSKALSSSSYLALIPSILLF